MRRFSEVYTSSQREAILVFRWYLLKNSYFSENHNTEVVFHNVTQTVLIKMISQYLQVTLSDYFLFQQIMYQQLLAKRSEYLPVAEHGALLFSVISGLFRLNAYYHFRLETFLQLCHETIVHRCGSKKLSGSAAARAAELVDALTKNIYPRISWSLFLGGSSLCSYGSLEFCHKNWNRVL